MNQVWPAPDAEWHCVRNENQSGSACVKILAGSENALVKSFSDDESELVLYCLAAVERVEMNTDSAVSLVRQKSGWLDFCPDNNNEC